MSYIRICDLNENMGKGGCGGHASNQLLVVETPVVYTYPPPANADRMRKWSDEEIAEFTVGIADGVIELLTGEKMPADVREEMKKEWLQWLQMEAEP